MELWMELCVQAGPASAWEGLVARFGPGLRARIGAALRRAGVRPRAEQVEELAQEVYCHLLAGGGHRIRRCRAASDRQLAAFLGRVAERVVLDQLRAARALKRGRDRLTEGDPDASAPDPRDNPEERLLVHERVRQLLRRCGGVDGQRDYRRNARILALAAAGWRSDEISRALGGALSRRGVEGVLRRQRRHVARLRQLAL
jgi:DNA-directed RNA polymerase specialized sigma24 family protein